MGRRREEGGRGEAIHGKGEGRGGVGEGITPPLGGRREEEEVVRTGPTTRRRRQRWRPGSGAPPGPAPWSSSGGLPLGQD